LISGHPLYLLNSKIRSGGLAFIAEAMQATGSVRLQVTGKPPTCNTFSAPSAGERVPTESNAAAAKNLLCLEHLKCMLDLFPPCLVHALFLALVPRGSMRLAIRAHR
jgi:hypothetical protein